MKSFSICYFFFKNLFIKKNKSYFFIFIFIFILIFILSIRFLIKALTGFSYFSIKISSYIVVNLIELLEDYEYDNYKAVLHNLLLDLNSTYYYSLKQNVLDLKIYYENNNIIFNPWYKFFFKDTDNLKSALKHADKLFKLRFLETTHVSAHLAFCSILFVFFIKKNFFVKLKFKIKLLIIFKLSR